MTNGGTSGSAASHRIGMHAVYRAALPSDHAFLRAMLYEAFAWRLDIAQPSQAQALARPEIARYVDGWLRDGDAGVIAEHAGTAIGAAWYRHFDGDERGYGFVAAGIPELTIGVAKEARGIGVGTGLLRALTAHARAAGLPGLSLSVEEDNPALRLYERSGFQPVGRVDNAWTMLLDLSGASGG